MHQDHSVSQSRDVIIRILCGDRPNTNFKPTTWPLPHPKPSSAAHPRSMHLPGCSLSPVTSVHRFNGQTPHKNQAQILVSPHPDHCTFVLVSLCPSWSPVLGNQPMLSPAFQQHGLGMTERPKAGHLASHCCPPLVRATPSSTALGQLRVRLAASSEQEASAGKRSAGSHRVKLR